MPRLQVNVPMEISAGRSGPLAHEAYRWKPTSRRPANLVIVVRGGKLYDLHSIKLLRFSGNATFVFCLTPRPEPKRRRLKKSSRAALRRSQTSRTRTPLPPLDGEEWE